MSQVAVNQRSIARNSRKNDFIGLAFVLPFLLVYVVFLLWPVIFGLYMSFFNWSLVGKSTQFLGLTNYAEALSDGAFWGSFWHTILYTVISTPLLIVLSLTLALLVNSIKRGQWIFRLAFFAPYVLPVSAVVLIWNWIYQPGFGLINGTLAYANIPAVNWLSDPNVAMYAIIILSTWWTIGFDFVLYLAGLQQIPGELYEAASVDGASKWMQVRAITVPLLSRTTFTVVILQVISSLQVFAQIYLLTAGGPNFSTRPIIQYIYTTGFTQFRVGFASSMSYILFVFILLITAAQFIASRKKGA